MATKHVRIVWQYIEDGDIVRELSAMVPDEHRPGRCPGMDALAEAIGHFQEEPDAADLPFYLLAALDGWGHFDDDYSGFQKQLAQLWWRWWNSKRGEEADKMNLWPYIKKKLGIPVKPE